MDEERRTVVVMGATGGVGRAVSHRLSRSGARVWALARPSDRLEAISAELGTAPLALDAVDLDAVDEAMEAVVGEDGRLDGVVNAVGEVRLGAAHRTARAEWDAVVGSNLTTAFAAVRSGAPRMRATGGSIVLLSSTAAVMGLANHEAVAAAKGGVVGLARSAAASYARWGVRVNVIAPGLLRTPGSESIWSNDRSAEASRRMHPLGRLGTAEDVGSLVEWLLAPENDWMTGQVLALDGGLSAVRT
jgi:NAD(P)-dependent dehydrogenase (short-subunit alcohol dehydrogenase family)